MDYQDSLKLLSEESHFGSRICFHTIYIYITNKKKKLFNSKAKLQNFFDLNNFIIYT